MKKKSGQKRKENYYNDNALNLGVKGKVVIILVVLILFVAFYLLTIYIVNKDSNINTDNKVNESQEKSISYDKILLGRSFSMNDDDYYVIYYDSSNKDTSSIYNELVTNYKVKEDALPIYYVDMGDGLNKSHSTNEESNRSPNGVDDLLINGPTLIRFQDGKVIDYRQGEEDIKNILN